VAKPANNPTKNPTIRMLDHILQRGAAFRERGAALRVLINAGKPWVMGVDCPDERPPLS
jgi:hypothetical protein